MLFQIYNRNTKDLQIQEAFDMNALRRNLKKSLKVSRIPDYLRIRPMTHSELEQMFRGSLELQGGPMSEVEAVVDAEKSLEEMTQKVEEVISETASL